jgi:predicted helicase
VVARDIDGGYWAIQCKCWAEASQLTFKAASTFFATAQADGRYSHYMIVDTVTTWSKTLVTKAEALGTVRIDVAALGDSTIDWAAFLHGQSTVERRLYEPYPYQRQAIDDCLDDFATHDIKTIK